MMPDQIKEIRHQHGLTQQALADRLGVSVRTVQKWEQGERGCKGAALKVLSGMTVTTAVKTAGNQSAAKRGDKN